MKKYIAIITSAMIIVIVGCQGNHAPVIQEVIAIPDSIGPGDNTTLFVDAEDEDGDALTITWSCITGTFSSTTGNSVIWTAPDSTGVFAIYVIVEDEEGLTDDGYKGIRVSAPVLDKPVVSYTVIDLGSTLNLSWIEIPYATGYFIYADSVRIDTISSSNYDATVPAALYEISAYAGSVEGEREQINCVPVITDSLDVWDMSQPPPDPSGFGFSTSGVASAYDVSDSLSGPLIDYYIESSPQSFWSPHHGNYNSEVNATVNSGITDFDALNIADGPGVYTTMTVIVLNSVYSFWIDPTNNGWDDTTDHFGKIKVIGINGTRVTMKLAYQPIPGLRWLVTD